MAPKYQMLADALRADIQGGVYQADALLPTEQLLCHRFQVSRQTVRQALSLLVSEGLIERRQGSGSKVRDRTMPGAVPRRSVAVVATYIGDYIFPGILREAEAVLSEHNCTLSIFATQNQVYNERKVLQTLLDSGPLDGVLVEGTKTALPNPNLDLYRQLLDRGVPLVFMNGGYADLTGALSVLDDNYNGGRMLVEYLHKKGHRNIAGIFKSDDIQGHQRYAGYANTLRDLDLPMEDQRVFWYNTGNKGRLLSDAFGDTIGDILDGCTAVVCYNDEVASRMIGYLLKARVKIPGEMAVVSFDNSQYSDLCPVPITSLSHESYNVGRMAAKLLMRLLLGEPCRSEVAPWTLIEKESS